MTSKTPLPPGMVSNMPELARGAPTDGDAPVAYTGSDVANGFLYAFIIAYCRHKPLRLRPDDVAQAVLVGAAGLVSAHAKASARASPPTRPMIDVEVSEHADVHRPGFWDWVLDRIQGQCPPEDVPAMGPFSTSTRADTTARTIAIMAALGDKFRFGMMSKCGIPAVWLQGTAEDWSRLRRQVGALMPSQPAVVEWVKLLDPVLAQFEAMAATGVADVGFWEKVLHRTGHRGSGSKLVLSGWITLFFPVASGDCIRTNMADPGARLPVEDAPAGYSWVPFSWTVVRTLKRQFVLSAGHWQVAEFGDGSVAPWNQWSVCDQPPLAKMAQRACIYKQPHV